MENGIKYNKAEVPQMMVEAEESIGYHIISFKDNGIGIEGEYQYQILTYLTDFNLLMNLKGVD